MHADMNQDNHEFHDLILKAHIPLTASCALLVNVPIKIRLNGEQCLQPKLENPH